MAKQTGTAEPDKRLVTVWTPWGEQAVPRKNSRAGRIESIRRVIDRLKAAKQDKKRPDLQA